MYEYQKLNQEQKYSLIQERHKKGHPLHSPPHKIQGSEFYFITVTCYKHKNRINTEQRRQQLLNEIFDKFINKEIEILAWVLLPNHYHLLVRNVEFKQLGQTIRSIHEPLARQWNLEENTTGKVWCAFSDRAIRSERHY